jgi:laminin, alpha 1/2
VTIEGKNRVITLTKSNGKNKNHNQIKLKIPKRLFVSNTLFIGGLPANNQRLPKEVLSKKDDFKGCIRRFSVNGVVQDLTKRFFHLGQCFPRVERGSYFSGDAFAIYSKDCEV